MLKIAMLVIFTASVLANKPEIFIEQYRIDAKEVLTRKNKVFVSCEGLNQTKIFECGLENNKKNAFLIANTFADQTFPVIYDAYFGVDSNKATYFSIMGSGQEISDRL